MLPEKGNNGASREVQIWSFSFYGPQKQITINSDHGHPTFVLLHKIIKTVIYFRLLMLNITMRTEALANTPHLFSFFLIIIPLIKSLNPIRV